MLQLLMFITYNFIFSLQKYSICKLSYIFQEKIYNSSTFKFTVPITFNENEIWVFPFPSRTTGMFSCISLSCPELLKWFLVFPVPVPNTEKAFFLFSHSRPEMQKVIPAHAGVTWELCISISPPLPKFVFMTRLLRLTRWDIPSNNLKQLGYFG